MPSSMLNLGLMADFPDDMVELVISTIDYPESGEESRMNAIVCLNECSELRPASPSLETWVLADVGQRRRGR